MVRETLIFILILVADRNPNDKIKRWMTFVDVNYVAYALSRQNIQKKSEDLHVLEEKAYSYIATVHTQSKPMINQSITSKI